MANRVIERLSDGLQNAINTIYLAKGKGRRPVKSFLNGTWLRHPLHPLLTDVAIGGVVTTAVLDIIWLAAPGASVWAPRAAEVTLAAGLAGMLGSIGTGLADWADTYGAERTVGLTHGALNILAFIAYLVSGVLRLQASTGDTVTAAIIGFAAFALVTVAGFLGGDMVFHHGTNVNHTAWEHSTEDYEAVGALAGIPENALTRVVVGGVPVVLVRLGDKIAAIAATCTHAGGPLDEGTLAGDVVTCPWHGSRFHLTTGRVVTGPATSSEPRYDARVRDGVVELKRH